MAKTRKQKEEIVSKIEGALKASAAVFVGFSGISVAQESAMRRGMRGEGVRYFVAKKTLLKRALKAAGHDTDVELPGEVALAYATDSADTVAPARRVHASGKEFGPEKVSILGGLFEGKLMSAAEMVAIATIPSMQALRGMFANVINSPRQRFAVVLSKVAETKN
jgi:large subunit ribosomal protein L10